MVDIAQTLSNIQDVWAQVNMGTSQFFCIFEIDKKQLYYL